MRALLLLLTLLTCALGACAQDNLLDGTWRESGAAVGEDGRSFELVLGQYVSDVAGLVRVYEPLGEGGSDAVLFGTEQYCRPIERGRFDSDVLSFQHKDASGEVLSFSLALDGDDRLNGELWSDDDAQPTRPVSFTRRSDEVDKRCNWLSEIVVHGSCSYGAPDDLPEPFRPRAALVYLGYDSDNPCLSVGAPTVELDRSTPDAAFFSLVVSRKPDACLLVHEPGRLTVGWGVFVAFNDTDGDGRWDRDPLPGGTEEPVLAVAPGWALLYLDGAPRDDLFEPDGILEDVTEQSFSLVQIGAKESDGKVTELRRIPATELATTAVQLFAVEAGDAPPPRLLLAEEP